MYFSIFKIVWYLFTLYHTVTTIYFLYQGILSFCILRKHRRDTLAKLWISKQEYSTISIPDHLSYNIKSQWWTVLQVDNPHTVHFLLWWHCLHLRLKSDTNNMQRLNVESLFTAMQSMVFFSRVKLTASASATIIIIWAALHHFQTNRFYGNQGPVL